MSAEKTLLAGIGSVLTIAGSITKATNGPRLLLAKLGWDLPPGVDDIGLAGLDMARVGAHLTEWSDLANDPEVATEDQVIALAQLADAVIDVLDQLSDLQIEAPQEYLDRTRIKDEFLTRLLDLYLIQSVVIASPPVFDIAVLLGWFELQRLEADPTKFQVKHIRHTVHWDRVPKLFTDPTGLFRETYGWGTPTFDPDTLVIRVGAVLQHIAAEVRHRKLPGISLARMNGGQLPQSAPQLQLLLPLLGSTGPLEGETGISVFGLPPTTAGGTDGGIGLAPYAEGAATLRVPLSSIISVGMSAKADLGSGIAVVFRPDKDPVLHTDLNKAQSGAGVAGGEINLDLTLAMPEGASPLTLISAGGAKVEAKSIAVSVGALVDNSQTDAVVRLELKGSRLTVKPEDLPFLGSAADDGLTVDADVDLSWSHQNGVQLGGRAELKISKTIGRSIGPVTIDGFQLALATKDDGVALKAGLNLSVKIGPVLLVIDEIGVRSTITPGPGSLGSADLTIRPVPPTGIGLEVKAPGVVGGGFLRFDFEKHEYSGVLQLEIAEKISVKAIGLLNTRLPDGSKGYSLVLLIFVEGFTPIQLGLGFALTGIGGLVALNRTFNEETLRSGLKNHTLDSVMFPHDPIRNAPQIISNLNRVFPPAAGHHLFGPMVQISWGTPTLITAEVGVVLELGARLRLLILAQIAAILPRRDNDLVRLQMDAVGIIDFDQGTATLDATLYDSRLLKKFVLTGDMAMRLKWEGSRQFALSVGGLHPAFQPPPNFPRLERIAINLSAGDNPRLRCESYFAITSNTVQFGARAELYAAAAGFTIHGDIGYDVLIQFDPFFFLAEFHAQLQLKRGSTNLFKVKLEGSLAGPRPLHLKGKATFEILWWDVTIRVDTTLVKGERPPAPAPIDVLPRLKEALSHPDNWVTRLPQGQRPVVTLATRAETTEILLHPLGTLEVKETVVPLNMDISHFGQAAPAGDRRFSITTVNIGGEDEQTINHVRDFFAPAQFLEMTDDEKLSRPSFEQMDAGVKFLSEAIVFTTEQTDWLEAKAIEFETWILDKGTNVAESTDEKDAQGVTRFYQLSALQLGRQARFGAAGSSELRRTGKARYRTTIAKHKIAKEGWAIVDGDDLTPQPLTGVEEGRPASYSEAAEELRRLKQETPAHAARFKLLRPSELEKV
ncbi:MAG TPA: DUF6603 domain-containing protein [Pyrinomonadaceae bacterium]